MLFDSISKKLGPECVTSTSLRLAAVAIIIRDRGSPSVLMIKRAERKGDPWSGQVAFPGGKMQEGGETARGTAVRETYEEVGIDLGKSAEFLGFAEATVTHNGAMEVVPAVFLLRQDVRVNPNQEVASHRWIELEEMLSSSSKSVYRLNFEGRKVNMPAYSVGDYTIWGLTYRIVTSLVGSDPTPGP
ncbi:MAG TPA: CoA pyrophosphatase [Nitrososphaerales archaeon]|nr:CoA pyrophosphatase [Nitrososphaerales archaeon]